MYLESLVLKNFRSYDKLNARFSEGINILQGKNAAGKTNVLEAIGILSFGRSFRTGKDAECIKDGNDTAYVKGGIVRAQGPLFIEALVSKQDKKSLKVSGEPVRKMGELFGNFIAVVFSPEDIKVLKESPSLRRRFIDMEISKLKPTYFYELQEYYKSLAQKNALLKSRMKEEQLRKLVSIYNEQLAEHGEKIILQRGAFLEQIDKLSRDIHRDLAAGETLSLKYKSTVSGSSIKQTLYEKMDKALGSEIEQGFSLHGPHREDIAVSLDGSEIKSHSSQGQIRTAMLSLKLATLDLAAGDFNDRPVLLLDDVFSELDAARQAALLSHIKNTQCFITTAVAVKNVSGTVFTVKDGTVAT